MSEPYIDEELKNPPPVEANTTEKLNNELLQLQIDTEKLKLQRERDVDTMINNFLGIE